MEIIERLHGWLISYVNREILAVNRELFLQPDVICNGVEVKEITLKADLVIQMDEETVWGIFYAGNFLKYVV